MPKDNSHACDCGLPTCPLCVEAAWERLEKALKARGPAPLPRLRLPRPQTCEHGATKN